MPILTENTDGYTDKLEVRRNATEVGCCSSIRPRDLKWHEKTDES